MLLPSLWFLQLRLDILLWVHSSLSWHEINAQGKAQTSCQRVILELVYFPLRARASDQECSEVCDQQFHELMSLIYSRVQGPHMLSRRKTPHVAYLNPGNPFFNVDECVHHRLFCFNTMDSWVVTIDKEKGNLRCVQGPASHICTSTNLVNQLRLQYESRKQSCGTVCSTCMCRRFLFMLVVRRDRKSFRPGIVDELAPPSGFGCSPDEICKRFSERAETKASGWSCLKGHYAGDVLCEPKHQNRCEICRWEDQGRVCFPEPCLNAAMMMALLKFSQKYDRWSVGWFDHLMDDEVRVAVQELNEIETSYYVSLKNDPIIAQDLTNVDSFPRTGPLNANPFDELTLDRYTPVERQFAAESSRARVNQIRNFELATSTQAKVVTNFHTTENLDSIGLPWEVDHVLSSRASDDSIFAPLDSGRVRLIENLESFEHRSATIVNDQGGTTAVNTDQSNNERQLKRPRWSNPNDQTTFSRHSMSELGSVRQGEQDFERVLSVVDLTRMSRPTSVLDSVDPDNLQFSDFFRDHVTSVTAPVTALDTHSPHGRRRNDDPDNLQFSSYFAALGESSDDVTGKLTAQVYEVVNQHFPGEVDGIP